MPFDLTSIWIPVGIIGLLGLYMVAQFIQERRESRELLAAEAAAAATAAAAPPPAEKPVPAPAAAPVPSAPAEKKKAKLRWRTAWIWLPFLAGFFGQAYLSFIKPMMDASGQ